MKALSQFLSGSCATKAVRTASEEAGRLAHPRRLWQSRAATMAVEAKKAARHGGDMRAVTAEETAAQAETSMQSIWQHRTKKIVTVASASAFTLRSTA